MGAGGLSLYMRLKSRFNLKFKSISARERVYYELLLSQEGGFANRFLTKNDSFIDDIVDGSLKFRKDQIENIDGQFVNFKSGKREAYDVIVCSTGYQNNLSFIDSSEDFSNARDLFKHMLHPQHGKKIALIGWARPVHGGVPAASEMQARFLGLLLSGKKAWPGAEAIRQTIESDRNYEESTYHKSPHLKTLVDYHQFMTSFAKLVGCSPKLNPIGDLNLYLKYWYGSHLSYFYRLDGPGAEGDKAKHVLNSLPNVQSTSRDIIFTLVGFMTNLKHYVLRIFSFSK